MQPSTQSYFKTFCSPDLDLQKPFDVCVVIPSILRPALSKALQSVFDQDLDGRIQILVGIDKPYTNDAELPVFDKTLPDNIALNFFYPGYSTSRRHGGIHKSFDGGSLRCTLSFMANSPYIAYLDDDNWWAPHHLSDLKTAIEGHDWAYSLRWYVHPESLKSICVDTWESVGPGKGVHNKRFGGVC